MNQAQVTLDVRRAGSAAVIDVRGDLTSTAESALMDAYNQASEGNTRVIILNFTDMEYMNSSGIGLLVTLLIRINRQKQRLFTFGLSDHYQHIFELTRLNDAIGIYGSEAEALKAASAK